MGSARDPVPSAEVVRRVLLGLHGPYADPRDALDALDDVEVLVAELEVDAVVELGEVLVELATDPDAVVATGAVLALDVVRARVRHAALLDGHADPLAGLAARMIDLALDGGAALDRAPTGFTRATCATLRGELAIVAARSGSPAVIAELTTLVERAASIGVERVVLVTELAGPVPALVVANARVWVGPGDSAVLARLREHHRRIAVATAVRPWEAPAIAAVEAAGRWQRWHEAETLALVRVMRDDAPELTAPTGVGDAGRGGRWWIEAERVWDWTVWRCDDGRAVLELVEGGVGMWTSVREVPGEVAATIVAAAAAGVEPTGRQIVVSLPPGSP